MQILGGARGGWLWMKLIPALAKYDKVGVDEPDWNWRLTVVQSECKTTLLYRVVEFIFNENRQSTYIISNLVQVDLLLAVFEYYVYQSKNSQTNKPT